MTILPTALVAIPFGAVIALQLGSLTRQLGAQSFTGSASVLAVLREASPIVTALLIAGAGGSAICADLGARKIRDEIDAMEVLGINPIQRLVVPRVLASMLVAVLLNGLVSVVGVAGGYFFNVVLQGGTPGAYLASFSALAQVRGLLVGRDQGADLRLDRRHRRLLQGAQRRRRAQGRRRRGEPVRGHHLPAAVRGQLRDHRDLLPARPAEGAVMALLSPVDRLRSGPAHRAHGLRQPLDALDDLGDQLGFYGRALAWTPRTLRRYKREILRLLAEVTFGTGALAVIGGTVGVIAFLSFFTGTEVGPAGLRGAGPARHVGVHRLPLGLLQHPGDRARWWPGWRCRRRSAAASPRRSARCGSTRRSTPSRSWACPRCRSW